MFWRFGFHNGSAIDSLLDKEDVSPEAILDEDDLLQECKSQNTRLIDYFGRVEVLQKLLGYVTGQIESEERARFKYPYVATEVLCSGIWSIVETCLNEQEQLLVPFWETVLDRSSEDMKTEMIMASHFLKINAVFLTKKPAEMLAFIQSQPSVVERLLRHVEMPPFVDLIVRMVHLDELPGGAGVLEWLSSENLMGRLVGLLSPMHSADVHTIVSDLIKGMVSMATPSPGAGLTDGLQNGPASNRFARELARKDNIFTLVSYMLHDFGPSSADDDFAQDYSPLSASQTFPNFDSSSSSVVNSISVVIELIRKNNSDFFEPYLFHTLRNRLIQVQQHLHLHTEDARDQLEQAMREMVDRIGVVHLGPVLEVICPRLEEFQQLLTKPRSLDGSMSLTVGSIVPLTLERYRICELFAELLHCSSMSLLNRPASASRLYDLDGRLQGGLSALEDLARLVTANISERSEETLDDSPNEIEPALELPVSSSRRESPSLESDDGMSDGVGPGSSDEDAMEEIVMYDEPQNQMDAILSPSGDTPPTVTPSPSTAISPSSSSPSNPFTHSSGTESDAASSNRSLAPSPSRRSSSVRDASPPPIGEQLRRKYLDMSIVSTLLDLFFEFPWNNFLHSAVYDLLHQILTSNTNSAINRELIYSLFRDARLMDRIIEGQKRNDAETSKAKAARLGYMGHLTLISEDVISVLPRLPRDMQLVIDTYTPHDEWMQYISGRYDETRRRDARELGGGKPVVSQGMGIVRRRVDEQDDEPSPRLDGQGRGEVGGMMHGQFTRSATSAPRNTADFGPVPTEDEEDEEDSSHSPQFARYLAEEINTSDQFGSSSSDDDDDDGGWLSQSTFSLGPPPVSARHYVNERRPLRSNAFEDAFDPNHDPATAMAEDPFNPHDDDGFGPFSDAAVGDPFTNPTSLSDEQEDSSLDDFADFGDFQSAEAGEGDLTPTTGSWTLASDTPSAGNERGVGGNVASSPGDGG